MTYDRPFTISLIVSLCVHAILMFNAPLYDLLRKNTPSFKKIELTYFNDAIMTDFIAKDAEVDTSFKAGSLTTTAEVELAKVEVAPAKPQPAAAVAEPYTKAVTPDVEKAQNMAIEAPDMTDAQAEAFGDYCLLVREKIRAILQRKGFSREGEVNVKFVIDKTGQLRAVAVIRDSRGAPSSVEAAVIESIKEASPFPAFGDKIKKDVLVFTLPIRSTR